MDQVIHGVNNSKKNFLLSNYSLKTQIIITNILTALMGLLFIIFLNFYLLISNKNLDKHRKIVTSQLDEITNYLSNNAIKRILTFNDTCNSVSEESNRELARIGCDENNFLDKNYEDKPPQLDPTYTQQYIYSNFSNYSFIVKVFADNWIKIADTNDFYIGKEDIVVQDINSEIITDIKKNIGFYESYKSIYFYIYNRIQKYFDIKKLKKLKNDNITVMETIKTKKSTSYMFRDQDKQFKSIFASPILKDDKVYGVVLIIAPHTYENNDGAHQSILLFNFFLFFISIMFSLSLFFSKSIVAPIKLLSRNAQLERDKTSLEKTKIEYPIRRDEIGILSSDIKSMSDDLKKRIKEIEEFAADVSHELKNPLSSLKSSSDLLYSKKLDNKNTDILIKNIGLDIERMNILISDISNYTLTQVEISEEALEDTEIINFLKKFKNSFSYEDISLKIKSIEKEIYLEINKNKFLQVLHNLLDNASSYIKDNPIILIFIKVENNKCIIHFVDQGPGISMDYKYKIFDRFYTDRVSNRISHSGLGLSISKNIIESFGGIIRLIKSEHLGFEGACFEIILPLKDL